MKPTRATVALLSIVLALATALTLTATAVTLASSPSSADAAANLTLVRRFYDALNQAIATGDLAAVEALVAPDLTVGSGEAAGLDSLQEQLLAIHAARPDLWLRVEESLVDGDRVVARVAIDGLATATDRPTALLGAPVPDSPLWASGDRIRIVDGRIAAFDGIALALAPARALIETVATSPALGQAWLGLARLTAAPQAAVVTPAAAGPVVYLVERGTVAVRLDRGEERRLGAGDQLTVPAGTVLALRNPSAAPATLLTAALVASDAPWPPRFNPPASLTSIVPDDVASQASASSPLMRPTTSLPTPTPAPAPAAVRATSLGGAPLAPGRLRLGEGGLRLTLTRLALAPGRNLLPLTADGLSLLAIESGHALVGPGAAGDPAASDLLLAPGATAFREAGTNLTIQPTSDDPLGLLVLTLSPA